MGITEAELFKQMETGSVLAAETLPKVAAAYKKAALEGGAYALALKGLRVTEGQMVKASQEAGDKIFKSGFSAGLSDLYKTIADMLKNSGPQLQKLGRIFGSVFKGIAYSLRLIEPIMRVFIDNFEIMFGAYALKTLSSFATMANLSLAKAFLPITAALAAAEELMSLFSDDIVGITESTMGRQFNLGDGTTSGLTKKDGVYNKSGAKSDMMFNPLDLLKNTPLGAQASMANEATRLLMALGTSSNNTNTTNKVEVVVSGLPNYLSTTIKSEVDLAWSGGSVGESG